MYQHTDPKRESEPYALPDVVVWSDESTEVECPSCGLFDLPRHAAMADTRPAIMDDNGDLYPDTQFPDESQGQFEGIVTTCPSCQKQIAIIVNEHTDRIAYWYAFGFPGCLHDSDMFGPFDTEALALADARETAGV